ncbi:MAG TPA: autotransporter-associated beta strand repeat-containing protein [Tepidisphaeraceae bacterium]|jgi:autotransporter-associated beta strand protein|nr:autotransporter-associated beta strand repeat-containing protein [Tepidisphaeraceae bacterium]
MHIRELSGKGRPRSARRAALYAAIAGMSFVLAPQALDAGGVFTTTVFSTGNQMSDTNVGLNSSYTYQDTANINGAALTINGVNFAAGGLTSGGTSPNTWGLSAYLPTSYTGNVSNIATSNQLYTLDSTFTYNADVSIATAPEMFTLNGLTAGQVYSLAYYNVAFGSPGGRVMTTINGSDGGTIAGFDENASGAGNGNVLRYTFVATGATETLTFNPAATDSYHFYGFSNQQVFTGNTFQSASGSNWSTATYSVPAQAPINGVAGTNVTFPSMASASTVVLDTSETVGHIQFSSPAGWSITGGNTLTLQSDATSASVLNAAAGTNTIAVPVVFSTPVAALGTSTSSIVFNNTITSNGNLLTVGSGTVQFGDGVTNTFSDGPVAVNNGGTLVINTNGGVQNLPTTSPISGTGAVNFTGSGNVYLSTTNTFSGPTTISPTDIVNLFTGNALENSAVTVANQAGVSPATPNLVFNGSIGTFALGGLNGSTNLPLVDIGNSPISLMLGGVSTSASYSGNLSGVGASITKVGTGTQILSGTNTYTGGTVINAGTLQFNKPVSLPGYTQAGMVTVNGGGTLALLAGGPGEFATTDLNNVVTNVIFGSGSVLAIDTTDVSNGGSPVAITTNINGSEGLTKNGPNTLTLSGNNTFAGPTTVVDTTASTTGSLTLGSTNALQNSPTTLVGTNTSLVFSSGIGNFAIGSISGSAPLALQDAGGTAINLTLGGGNSSGSYSGVISGTGATITKVGTGTQALTGANTYTGVTTLNNGILNFANGGLGSGNITFTGGTLQYAAGNAQDISARIKNSTAAVTIDTNGNSMAFTSVIDASNTAGFTKAGAGTLSFAAPQLYGGTTTVGGGTLRLGGGAVGAYATSSGFTFTAAANNQLAGLTPTVSNPSPGAEGSGGVGLLTNGAVNTTTPVNANVYTIGNSSVLTYALPLGSAPNGFNLSAINLYSLWNDAGRSAITLNSISYSTVAAPTSFAVIPGSNINFSPSGGQGLAVFSASGAAFVTNVADLQFNFGAQENNYVGYAELEAVGTPSTTVSGGGLVNVIPVAPLQIASGATLDLAGATQTVTSLSSTTAGGAIVNNAASTPVTFTVNQTSGSATFSGTIGDNGPANAITFVKSGAGTQVLAAPNTYSGPTVINAGVLRLASPPAGSTTTVLHYTFDGNLNDSSGNGNNAAFNPSGTPTYVPGHFNQAISLDGTSQYVSTPYSPSLNVSGAFTVSLWEKLNTPTSGGAGPALFSTRNGGDNTVDIQVGADGGLHADVGNGIGWLSTGANATVTQAPLGTNWNMVTYTFSTSGYNIYLNGVPVNSGTYSGAPLLAKAGESLSIGSQEAGTATYGNGGYIDGAIDDVNVFSTSLTAAQVLALYNSTFTGYSILPVTTPLSLSSTGTLDLGGMSQTVASISDVVAGQGGSITNSGSSSATLTVAQASGTATFSGVISDGASTVAVVKSGAGTQVLAGASIYSGGTSVNGGSLIVTGSLLSTGPVQVAANATLGGSGSVGPISAAVTSTGANSGGLVAPFYKNPAILTAPSVAGGTGLGFAFKFTLGSGASPAYGTATNSGNDVLHLTSATGAFNGPLSSANTVGIYLPAGLSGGQTFKGGFYADAAPTFASDVSGATYSYFEAVPGSNAPDAVTYAGTTYQPVSDFGLSITQSVTVDPANFSGTPVPGQVTQFTVVPEPTTLGLASIAALGLLGRRRRRITESA